MAILTHEELKGMIETKIKRKLPAWVRGFDLGAVLPKNAVTGRLYRGVNLLLGMFGAEEKGSNIFATSKQWYELAKSLGYFEQGGRPLLKRDDDGNKASGEVFVIAKQTKRMLKSQAEIDECPQEYLEEHGGRWYRRYALFKGFLVYNLMDLEPALVELVNAREAKGEPERAQAFDAFVDGLGISFAFSIQPAYSPRRDVIKMLLASRFIRFCIGAGLSRMNSGIGAGPRTGWDARES